MVQVQFGDHWVQLEATAGSARTLIESCCGSVNLPPKVATYPQRWFSIKLVARELAHERIVEDCESIENLLPCLTGGSHFLRLDEDPAKYEFIRRPQLIFRKDVTQLSSHYSNNRRFEDALEFYFRDRRRIDFSDPSREIKFNQELKWSADSAKSEGFIRGLCQWSTRKWQKAQFQLRSDAQLGPVLMYAPSKHLQQHGSDDGQSSTIGFYLFVILRDYDIFFSAADKKKSGGYLIILIPKPNRDPNNMPSPSGDTKYFLVESRAELNCWMSAMRLAKFGENLRTSYDQRASKNKTFRSHNQPSGGVLLNLHEGEKSKPKTGRQLSGSFSNFQDRILGSLNIRSPASEDSPSTPSSPLPSKTSLITLVPDESASSQSVTPGGDSQSSSHILDSTLPDTSKIDRPLPPQVQDTSQTVSVASQTGHPGLHLSLSGSESSQVSCPASMSSSDTSSRWSLLSSSTAATSDEEKSVFKKRLDKDDFGATLAEEDEHSVLVPLEFSGADTRVLTDPVEIRELQSMELERYLHRKYGTLTEEPWFSCAAKEDVESVLAKRGTIDGYFVVMANLSLNFNESENDPFVLCFVHADKIVYRKISQRILFRETVFVLEGNSLRFKDVAALVDFCKLNLSTNMPCLLTEHPIRK